MTRVGITDDHLLVLKGVSELLEAIPGVTVVGQWLDAAATRAGLEERAPDLLFLDINLPDGNGTELCKEFSERWPSLKIIALTTYNQASFIKQMMNNGAKGYLLKNTSHHEMQKAIEAVGAGGTYLQEEVREILASSSTSLNAKTPSLTRREAQIIELIADELTTSEIGEKLFISVKTVETHRQNLMQKLGARNTAGLIRSAINHGLIS